MHNDAIAIYSRDVASAVGAKCLKMEGIKQKGLAKARPEFVKRKD